MSKRPSTELLFSREGLGATGGACLLLPLGRGWFAKNQNKNKFLITGIKSAVNFMANHDYITEIELIIRVKILKHARYLFTHAGNKMTQRSLLSTLAS